MTSHRHRAALIACLLLCVPTVRAGDEFFLIDNTNNGFFRSDTDNVSGDVLVAQQAVAFWGDLAPSGQLFHLFATRVTSRLIETIRESDGAIVQSLMIDREARSLAYDVENTTLYGLPQSGTPELFVISLTTGMTLPLGPLAISESVLSLVAMVYDPVTSCLYIASTSGNLYAVIPSTLAVVLVGNFGLTSSFGMAYNPRDQSLYLTDATQDRLYRVDRTNAALTEIGGPYQGATFATGISFSNRVCQRDLGFGSSGGGHLSLCGGDLTQPGSESTLLLTDAPPFALAFFFAGVASNPTPLLGGVLVPVPPSTSFQVPLGATGEFEAPVQGIAGLGATVYVQAVTVSGSAVAFSNAVQVEL